MNPVVSWIGGIALLAVIALIVADVVRTPAPVPGRCTLTTRFLLPDVCVNSCTTDVGACEVAKRPYLIFFTQAARCADGITCL